MPRNSISTEMEMRLRVHKTRSEKRATPHERNGSNWTTYDRVVVERWDEDCIVSIVIDPAELRKIAEKACLNKTGKSRDGAVIAKVTSRKRLVEAA